MVNDQVGQNWGPFLLTCFIGIALAVLGILPPATQGLDTPADQFSSARAMKDVRIIEILETRALRHSAGDTRGISDAQLKHFGVTQ